MSSSSDRRRLSDSQVYRDRRTNLLPEPVNGNSSTAAEHKGTFETIGRQLELEEQLHVLCQQLLQSYKETQQWACVGQLAQGLVASSQRVGQLKQQLEALRNTSGGLFLEKIREQSLPRGEGEDADSDQSRVEIDTAEVVRSAVEGLKIPAEPVTQDSEQASEQPSNIGDRGQEEPFSNAETAATAGLLLLPNNINQSQEAGVPSTTVAATQSESQSTADSDEKSEPVRKDKVTSEEGGGEFAKESDLIFADKAEGEHTDLSTVVATSVVKGESPIQPLSVEDNESIDAPLVTIDTTADYTHTEDRSLPLACESESADTNDSETALDSASELTIPKSDKTPPPVLPDLTSDSVKPHFPDSTKDTSPLDSNSITVFSPELESDTPPAAAATEDQAPVDTDHRQSVDKEAAASRDNDDNLEPTVSVSSIEREFGTVDECLEELTSEIEALVIASEISSETSEQFFSPPESIGVEPEYEDAQQETQEEEGNEKFADLVDPEEKQTTTEPKVSNDKPADPIVSVGEEDDKPADPVVSVGEEDDKPADPIVSVGEEDDKPADPVVSVGEEDDKPADPVVSVGEEDDKPADPVVSVGEEDDKPGDPVVSVGEEDDKPTDLVYPPTEEQDIKPVEFAELEVPLQIEEIVKPTDLTESEEPVKPVNLTEQEAVLQEEKDIQPTELADPVVALQKEEERVEPADLAKQVVELEEEDVKPVDPAEPEVIIGEDKDTKPAVSVVLLEEEKVEQNHYFEKESSPEISFEAAKEEAEEEAGDRDGLSPVPVEAESSQLEQREEEVVSQSTTTSDSLCAEDTAEAVTSNQPNLQTQQEAMEPLQMIKYSVRRSFHSTSSGRHKPGSALYLIDVVADENGQRNLPVASQEVVRSLEDFHELHRELLSLGQHSAENGSSTKDVPLLDVGDVPQENGACDEGEREGDRESGEMKTDQSKILEKFLNQIVSDSHLRNEAVVTNFLTYSPSSSANGLVPPSETESTVTNGDILNSSHSPQPYINGQEEGRGLSIEEDDLTSDDRAVPGEGSPSKQESEEKEVMSEPSLPTGESVGDEDAPANLSEEEAAAGEMNSDLVGGRTELSCAEEDLKLKPECDSATRQEEDGSCVSEKEIDDESVATKEKWSEDVATTADDKDSAVTNQASPTKEIKTSTPDRSDEEISPEMQHGSCLAQGDVIPSDIERSNEVAGQVGDEGKTTLEERSVTTDSGKDSSSASPIAASPTHKESSPVPKEEEERIERSSSPTHEKTPSLSNEEITPGASSTAAGEDISTLEGGESDFSPTHSERTSSNATTSSYLCTTDDSMSPVKAVGYKPPPFPRRSSDPSFPVEDMPTASAETYDTFHMSLMPSQPWQPPVESQSADDSKRKKFKRKGSMPEKIRSSITTVKRSFSTKRRGQTINLDDESMGKVSMLKPLTTQEWDPTCLLEELYCDYKQGVVTTTNPSGEAARHYGYLDKLPTNRTKANVMTKWKRRYFRAQEGNIYYYQDRTANRALGFIHLTSARVVPIPEKMQIQIIPKNGKSIMLKAPDMDEFQTWHRALLLEAAHPTLVAPSSPKHAIENPTVIIDVGACSVRAGLVREDSYPEIFFPAVCSFDIETYDVIECGHAALLPDNRIKAQQVYPRKTSLRMDRQRTEINLPLKAMDAIISNVVMQLDIDPQASQLIMTLSPTTPEKERDELINLLLETFGFAGICLQDQTQLALFSYNSTTGVIVDIGNHITVVPYIDGYAIEAGVTRLPYGGNAITECLTKLVTQKGMRYFSETEMFINRFMKESLCYVSQEYEEDNAKSEENPNDFLRVVEVDRFQLPDHRKMITLDSATFKATEGLFSPHVWGKDILGLHDIVWKAIQACPIDQRRELSKKIFLSGGSSTLPGLKERLQKELTSLSPTGVSVEVHCSETSHHAAYCGAAVLASLGSFQNCLVNFEEWSTAGVEALKKWTGS